LTQIILFKMKKLSIFFLQFVLLLFGLFTLFLMLRFPLTEGRAVNLSLFEIYSDPFILYSYFASIAFYFSLVEVLKILKYIGQEQLFSTASIKSIKKIKFSAFSLCFFTLLVALYIRFFNHSDDDPAGFIALCIIMILFFIAVGIAAGLIEKSLQKALQMKTENDLTI